MFAQHGPTLRGFFVRRGANEDAEDLVQETYLRLLRAHHAQSRPIENPEAYLYTVALNLAREQAAKRRQAPVPVAEFDDLLAGFGSGDDPLDGQAQRAQRARVLHAALQALPDRTRAVLVMQYRDGMTYQQIAHRMGISTHMVKKHVVRGLSACRSRLAGHGEEI
ncbi:sigma-70 family RNA polymerase sigma factor [Stenotrophomonas maltophilia]|uniref:RNA polymerase sigma factor n=1 Tax=Stenotrophomonas maltophilia TaxID=40324 RepID=UPI0019D43D44|nr:sigma-70 family RNA polymerase sigma factor [Stenotrophomonas maltophilia]MBN7830491.1 sigma-70 family RNA polymerase sigma factor [Stenotrophomonas maltophilia]MBN7833524.1 sigma-70 family RNA polymerase sigma factor [Stenotrophomonas maltophilia]MBN7859594.1 sigma-70 family RNA polymerase sigma factor [Stenotrophomonas maltophilia]MBN7916364.1 sigma-70 family RNA polymerase sigma factor [Stenotrophomonas maltophilia]MBO2846725.1 sigma-70 family RNA polymerase sigma factor [Stenotrophomona